jgi:hypothetical protein
MTDPQRPTTRIPAPDRAVLLAETNALLARHDLPPCLSLTTEGCDQDTANPVALGVAEDRRYVIKTMFRFPDSIVGVIAVANGVRARTGLPIPDHLCGSQPSDRLPLLVMAWMPGVQLRLALPAWAPSTTAGVCADWGRCAATWHRFPLENLAVPAGPPSDVSLQDHLARHRASVERAMRSLSRLRLRDPPMIARRLGSAIDALRTPLSPGSVKADEDVRDYLAAPEPSRITAMLDWEQLGCGDTAHASAMVFHRLWLMGLEDRWADFRSGYRRAGGAIRWAPQVEAYLLTRALGAAAGAADDAGRERALALIDRLGAGLVEEGFAGV